MIIVIYLLAETTISRLGSKWVVLKGENPHDITVVDDASKRLCFGGWDSFIVTNGVLF